MGEEQDPWVGYTQLEQNFSMFWGISVMLYEATLISDQSKFDTWFASCRPNVSNPDGNASVKVPIDNPIVTCTQGDPNPTKHGLTAQEVLGFGLFNNGGTGIRQPGNPSCAGCHGPIQNIPILPAIPNPLPALVSPLLTEAAFRQA